MQQTAKYFFDAIDARFETSLLYRGIEGPKDMSRHPSVLEEVNRAVDELMRPFAGRKRVIFLCRENACRSQMAGAFAQALAGDRLDVAVGGSTPAAAVNPDMVAAMAEKGIDLGFRTPQGIEAALAFGPPDAIVSMGCGEACPVVPGAVRQDWDVSNPAGQPIEVMRRVRDDIEARVRRLIEELRP
jgi:protein-tyrosine-phosphatase